MTVALLPAERCAQSEQPRDCCFALGLLLPASQAGLLQQTQAHVGWLHQRCKMR